MVDGVSGTSGVTGTGSAANLDIETLFMSLVSERANVLDAAIAERAKAMQDRNAEIAKINEQVIAKRNEMKSLDKDSTAYKNKEIELQNMQTQIDSLSSNSQIDMIQLQGLINKRNQAIEMLTNLVSKFAQLMDKIVGNFR